MDDLGFNKVAGAVLATGLGVAILMKLPGLVMGSDYPDVPAYSVVTIEAEDSGEAIPQPFPQAEWVDEMDAKAGEKLFARCSSCHNVEQGGANGTGPNLWNIVGTPSGAKGDFAYSTPMKTLGTDWDYAALDGFLENPSKWLPGTKMAYGGLKKPAQRAAIIEYLRIQSVEPLPRPEPQAPVLAEVAETDAPDVTVPSEEMSMEQDTVDPSENDGDNIAEPARTGEDETDDAVLDQERISQELRDEVD